MPPLPEVRRVSGQKWAREIKRKLETKQLGTTASDVRVPRKIEKHLHGNRKTARPRSQPTRVRRRIVEVRIGHHGEAIGEHNFFYQTCYDEDDSTLDYNCRRALPRPDLTNELPGTNDRTGNQMRKECNEERVIDRVSHGLHFSPIDVEGVGQTGKGVEADADGQDNLQHHRRRRNAKQ